MAEDYRSVPGMFTSEARVGARVYLEADGKFFEGGHEGNEEYLGFIAGLTGKVVTLSTTHESSKFNGYVPSEERQKRTETRIEISRIVNYQILNNL